MAARTHDARKPPLSSRLMRATWRGLPAKRHDVGWQPGVEVPAADGSPLVTDHYFPRTDGTFPTLLVRSPYGRGLPWSPMYGILFAEQGFHVVLQSCRGTGGSGGRFDLWRNEAADGRATVTWLRDQPWFDGTLGTVGPSYLGYVQWALALDPPPELKAMVVQVGLHDPHALFHAGRALRLENALIVGAGMTHQHRGIVPFARATLRLGRRMRDIVGARPLRGAYASALLAWLRAHLCADPSGLRPTHVRVHMGGANAWRNLDEWPLSPAITAWFATPDGHLTRTTPTAPAARLASLRYDPADPTPSLGGPLLSRTAGPRDNSALEAREDVLTFTGPPLAEPLDVLGPVSARLRISTDTGHADVFTRLCDVDTRGRSTNVCDGLARLETTGRTPSEVTVAMSSTAHRFPAGHRVRWQISGGAHPRFARNPGTGESPLEAVGLTPTHITLHTGSALTLPR